MKVWIVLVLFACVFSVRSDDCPDNLNCPKNQIEEDCRHQLASKWPNLIGNGTVDNKEFCCSYWNLMECYQLNLCKQCGKTVADNETITFRNGEMKILELTKCKDYPYQSLKCNFFQFWVIGTIFIGASFIFSAIFFSWNKFRK